MYFAIKIYFDGVNNCVIKTNYFLIGNNVNLT